MLHLWQLTVATAVLCLSLANSYAADDRELLRQQIEDILVERDVPSAVVAVGNAKETIWHAGFGYADKKCGLRADVHVPYSIASISKPITATAVMMLVERGLVDLDAPIEKYLESTKIAAHIGESDQATVRRVLNHTAGFPHDYDAFLPSSATGTESTQNLSASIMLAPGETYQYSNLGYALLERVVENVGDLSYAAFLRQTVFAPLRMTGSFVPPEDPWPDVVAVRYASDNEPLPFYDTHHRAASATYASANDLLAFSRFHLDAAHGRSELLTQDNAWRMQRFDGHIPNGGSRGGLGFEIRNLNGHRIARHTGGMPGVNAELLIAPDDDLIVVVLLNKDVPAREEIVDEVLRVFAPHLRRPDDRSRLAQTAGGEWRGFIVVDEAVRVPVRLFIPETGTVAGTIGDIDVALKNVKESRGLFEISLANGGLPIPSAHTLRLKIGLRGDRLNGYATAYQRPTAGPIGKAISYWLDLEQAERAQPRLSLRR